MDQEKVLDAAEEIVRTRGIAALTIDGVAKAAGISKGGVQSSFGTKDGLITAMYARWNDEYDTMLGKLAAPDSPPMHRLAGHVEVTHHTDEAEADRAAGMLAALLNTPAGLASMQDWYAARLEGIDVTTPAGRRARLAFLANEGAFLLRSFGFMRMDAAMWDEMFADIRSLLAEAQRSDTSKPAV
ncbi:TetR/AcrR family transcriptional regulator [Pigmentiphaga aceris]|uniref:TetR/AcrR family transcriptional regulator n=1 Tax=Pigmentiphaga aceris TaxID=1940612 RepID=UPI001CA35CF1|nr:TetR/AcrR family transcriptional regulator [Pigmentiphaga aceris]